jgi:pimeloyl-ACP methyl ester carboxylesterase
MRIAVEPGIELNVRHRPGEGQPFVLVHGLSSNSLLWGELADSLGGHPSYAIDLRSHGESGSPDHGYDTATAAADVAVVIEQLGLDRPVVVGQSWGGNVVVNLAAKHPDLIGALGLVDGGWIDLRFLFTHRDRAIRTLKPLNMDSKKASSFRKLVAQWHPDWSTAAIEATLANFRVRPDGTLERRLPVPRHLEILDSLWENPPWDDFARITAPVLMLPAFGPDHAKAALIARASELLTNTKSIVWYPDGDHDLHAQRPAELAGELLKLVR